MILIVMNSPFISQVMFLCYSWGLIYTRGITTMHDDVIKCKHFFALLAICAGNSPATGEFPTLRPVTRSLGVFFDDLRVNKRLSKQSWGWWFETPSRSLWRHCNDSVQINTWYLLDTKPLHEQMFAYRYWDPSDEIWFWKINLKMPSVKMAATLSRPQCINHFNFMIILTRDPHLHLLNGMGNHPYIATWSWKIYSCNLLKQHSYQI